MYPFDKSVTISFLIIKILKKHKLKGLIKVINNNEINKKTLLVSLYI